MGTPFRRLNKSCATPATESEIANPQLLDDLDQDQEEAAEEEIQSQPEWLVEGLHVQIDDTQVMAVPVTPDSEFNQFQAECLEVPPLGGKIGTFLNPNPGKFKNTKTPLKNTYLKLLKAK